MIVSAGEGLFLPSQSSRQSVTKPEKPVEPSSVAISDSMPYLANSGNANPTFCEMSSNWPLNGKSSDVFAPAKAVVIIFGKSAVRNFAMCNNGPAPIPPVTSRAVFLFSGTENPFPSGPITLMVLPGERVVIRKVAGPRTQ